MRALVASLLVALAAAGCTGGGDGDAADGGPGEEVPLRIVEGPAGGVLAFAQVFVGGEGPYLFALDTGASRTAFDTGIVDELGLEATGRSERLSGIAATEEARIYRVSGWRVGDVSLPELEVAAISFPHAEGGGLDGLLGSDVLSRFAQVTVDYEAGVLRLAEPPD